MAKRPKMSSEPAPREVLRIPSGDGVWEIDKRDYLSQLPVELCLIICFILAEMSPKPELDIAR